MNIHHLHICAYILLLQTQFATHPVIPWKDTGPRRQTSIYKSLLLNKTPSFWIYPSSKLSSETCCRQIYRQTFQQTYILMNSTYPFWLELDTPKSCNLSWVHQSQSRWCKTFVSKPLLSWSYAKAYFHLEAVIIPPTCKFEKWKKTRDELWTTFCGVQPFQFQRLFLVSSLWFNCLMHIHVHDPLNEVNPAGIHKYIYIYIII